MEVDRTTAIIVALLLAALLSLIIARASQTEKAKQDYKRAVENLYIAKSHGIRPVRGAWNDPRGAYISPYNSFAKNFIAGFLIFGSIGVFFCFMTFGRG